MRHRSELSPAAGRRKCGWGEGRKCQEMLPGVKANFISPFPVVVYTYVCAKIAYASGNFHLNLN
jgi:hypothetical protein